MKDSELIKQSIDFSVLIVEYYKWLISYTEGKEFTQNYLHTKQKDRTVVNFVFTQN